MQIQLNGQTQTLTSASLSDLLKLHNIDASTVAIAINQRVIPSSDIASTTLQNGDVLEIVHAVCGG